jgi:hypothetical protein
MGWIKGLTNGGAEKQPANHVNSDDFSDHMLRDIGILDGRHSKGYERRRFIDGLHDDRFNGSL